MRHSDTRFAPRVRRAPAAALAVVLLAIASACGTASTSVTTDGATTGTTTGGTTGATGTTTPGAVPAMTALPLGDGKISTAPRVGYVFSCQTAFAAAPAGAAKPWITGTAWNATSKPEVQGSVSWPDARVTITREGATRVVSANNLPTHVTGTFPIGRTDPAFTYDANPNSIRAQTVLLQLPAVPVMAPQPTCVGQGLIGFTTGGAALYNALDANGRDAAAHEVQDKCDGHPQMTGQYHYHSYSDCLKDAAGDAGAHSDIIGYALDGYGIYGPKGESGVTLTNSALDVCHGHTHGVMWDGVAAVMYHYHMTREYPYSIGCYRGTRS